MEYRTWSLDRWVEMFQDVYGTQNANLSDEQIWLHVVEEAGELAEDLRKQHVNGVLDNVADTFAWVSAFSIRHGSLEEMVWNKFPGACCYCLVETDCGCIEQKPSISEKERENQLQVSRSREDRPRSIYKWQQMFNKIYGRSNTSQSVEQLGFHLMEEIGEVAKAMRLGNVPKLQDELADVFAWSAAIITRCQTITNETYRFDEVVWARYPYACPHCESNPCGEELYKKQPKTA